MGYLTKISILAVLADRDWSTEEPSRISTVFQSSRSLRTATPWALRHGRLLAFQSSRSLRTATMALTSVVCALTRFQSSRSLRTATRSDAPYLLQVRDFNPRGPCGPRRRQYWYLCHGCGISILAVLADRDATPLRR